MRLLGVDFNGQWIAVIVAFGGLILGNYIDNNRESARIERELEQDRIRSEKERKITTRSVKYILPQRRGAAVVNSNSRAIADGPGIRGHSSRVKRMQLADKGNGSEI